MEPIKQYDSATVYYLDDYRAESPTRSENVEVEIYPNWVHISEIQGVWIPRDLVEKVSLI